MILSLRTFALSLVAMLSLGMAASTAFAAQHQQGPEQMLAQLDGVQTAYARNYIAASELSLATPVAADLSAPSTMTVTVLEFETEAQVADAFENTMNGFVASMILGEPDLDLEESVVDDLGDRAMLYTGVEEVVDGPQQVALLAVQDGNLGILIQASGPDAAMIDTVKSVAAFMVEAEPGDTPVTVDGPWATGGTFDIMPTQANADAEVLHGLVPMWDYDLLRNGGDEPINKVATPAS